MIRDIPDGELPEGELPDKEGVKGDRVFDNGAVAENSTGDTMDVGTTQAAGSIIDSSNYSTYEEMVDHMRRTSLKLKPGTRVLLPGRCSCLSDKRGKLRL